MIANMRNITVDADAAVVRISSQQQTSNEETLQERLKYCMSGTGGSSLRWNGGNRAQLQNGFSSSSVATDSVRSL